MARPKTEKLVTLIGGSGFIGRHIVRALAREGYRVRVACRRPDLAGHLQPLGNLGQIQMIQANVRYPESLEAACRDSFAVINLVGLLANSGPQTFDACHVEGAEACARAAKAAGAEVFIQMSAIGADLESAANYAETKAEGEERAAAEFPGATILRPSIVFGPEDGFFNKFAAMARFSPALPLIGWGVTRFQPVFVGDVAKAVTAVLGNESKRGKIYAHYGPVLAGGRIVTASSDGLLRFFSPQSGQLAGAVEIPDGAATAPVVAGQTLYVVSKKGELHAFR